MKIRTAADLDEAINQVARMATTLKLFANMPSAGDLESPLDGVAASLESVADDLSNALEDGIVTVGKAAP